MDADLTI